MKKTLHLFILIALLSFSAYAQSQKKQIMKNNQNLFFQPYTTPFQTPPFEKIRIDHYMPAFEEGIKQHDAEIKAIAENPAKATFNNTILALDKSGKLLSRVRIVFSSLRSADNNDDLQKLAQKVTPMLSKHSNDISLNEKLFERIKLVYQNRNISNLNKEQIRTVEKYYEDFMLDGANLSAPDKESLRNINQQLSMLSLKFGDNLLAETSKNFKMVVDKEQDLAGLPKENIDAAAKKAEELGMKGKWVFTLDKPSWIPFLQYAQNRELREKLYKGYYMRCDNNNDNDNKNIIKDIVRLRAEKAKLIGFPNYAAYTISQNMSKTVENVDNFLNKLMVPALEVSKKELAEMQAIADREGANFKLASWDWWYYAEKLRKEKYDLDENELKPYFSFSAVRDGMFMVANKLYGITFTKLSNIALYHKDVDVFEVKEANGKHLGTLFIDPYTRPSKKVGAWCGSFQRAGWDNGKKVDPIPYIVCNFTPPLTDAPALLTFDETTTLFHEFGHALHGLFSEGKYNRTAGNVTRDYVELPSQIMENWASEPQVLRMYAKHYKTGEVIPEKLINKITNSSLFNQGFTTVEYLAASILDLDYHKLSEPAIIEDIRAFEKTSCDNMKLIPEILPRYRSTYFQHIFSGGYAAGYYVYIWAAVLDADAFDYFKQSGDLFNKNIAAKFRKHCLAEVGNDDCMVQYKKFRGQEPSQEPLLKRRGLK